MVHKKIYYGSLELFTSDLRDHPSYLRYTPHSRPRLNRNVRGLVRTCDGQSAVHRRLTYFFGREHAKEVRPK